ncbi:unnamed protein product [Prorocentrum cordatum]|uniref:Uncharacterized protein n=1 Tax=Prorocentrum cordatum TaxID=2364126 RepID=A0ABN9VJL0_9DINO|nr:unnamed protein product [Polarella glacialis]
MAGVAQSTRRRHVLAPHQRDRPRRCGGRLTAESGCRPRPARQGAAHAAGAGEGGRRGCMAAADRARVAVWRCSPAFEGASTVQHGAADRMALGLSCHRACVVGMQPIGCLLGEDWGRGPEDAVADACSVPPSQGTLRGRGRARAPPASWPCSP